MTNVIEIDGLTVSYGRKKALDGLTLNVEEGRLVGFLGPNGAGKSTAIKTLLGLVPPSSGAVRLHGLSPSDPRSREKVGFLPEEATYYRYLTPVETLTFYGETFGIPRSVLKPRVEKLLALVGLSDVAKKPIKGFSKGMTQKVSLAQSLVNDPDTLILDEPTSGLDPVARMELRVLLHDLKKQGKTIFFSSHELSEVELVCDAIILLKNGKIVRQGSLSEVLGDHLGLNLENFFLETMRGSA